MRVRLLCVGKPRDPRLTELHDDYAGRLGPMGLTYSTEWVPDVRAGGRYSPEHARQREGRSLLARLGDRGRVVALDARGDLMSSRDLAERLESWATPGLTLVVGGPSGLHPDVLGRAERVWSLSPLTFTHEWVRALVAEQLYRALSIRRGTPYHR